MKVITIPSKQMLVIGFKTVLGRLIKLQVTATSKQMRIQTVGSIKLLKELLPTACGVSCNLTGVNDSSTFLFCAASCLLLGREASLKSVVGSPTSSSCAASC